MPELPAPSHDKGTPIVVNGRPHKWPNETISFEDVIQLAFPNLPPDPKRIFTVTYKKGHEQGSLVAGKSVAVLPGMMFSVSHTSKS